MTIRMHEYPNGQTGLAAFCDVCGEQITEHGFVVWNCQNPDEWLVIHQARCDPGRPTYDCSMDLAAEIVYLAHSSGVDLGKAQRHAALMASLG